MNPFLVKKDQEFRVAGSYSWLSIESPAFRHGGILPSLYRSERLNINPPLRLNLLPSGTRSLAIIMADVDTPIAPRVHWICWDLPPTTQIRANEERGITGINDFQSSSYVGPCDGRASHKYFFRVFALDSLLNLPSLTRHHTVEKSILPHVLAKGDMLFFSVPSSINILK